MRAPAHSEPGMSILMASAQCPARWAPARTRAAHRIGASMPQCINAPMPRYLNSCIGRWQRTPPAIPARRLPGAPSDVRKIGVLRARGIPAAAPHADWSQSRGAGCAPFVCPRCSLAPARPMRSLAPAHGARLGAQGCGGFLASGPRGRGLLPWPWPGPGPALAAGSWIAGAAWRRAASVNS